MRQYQEIQKFQQDEAQLFTNLQNLNQQQIQAKNNLKALDKQKKANSYLPKNILRFITACLIIGLILLIKVKIDIDIDIKLKDSNVNQIVEVKSDKIKPEQIKQANYQLAQNNKNQTYYNRENAEKYTETEKGTKRYDNEPINMINKDQKKRYPEIGIINNDTSIVFQIQQLQSRRMNRQTLDIAKQYIRLGLEEPTRDLIDKQVKYYQQKYKLQQTYRNRLKSIQLPFCIIVPSYNNQINKRYMLPLVSIFRQDYSNYHVVYIDDASTDETANLVEKFVEERNIPKQKFKILRNKENKGPLRNQYQTGLAQCGEKQIVFQIDGDDGISGVQVLKLFNHFYQTTHNWFIYSNYIQVGNYALGVSRKIQNKILNQKSYRRLAHKVWITSHQKSFYNRLFHKMNKNNLMQYNMQNKQLDFFRVNADRALVYQLVQLSGKRIYYINQLTYLYVESTELSEAKLHFEEQIRVQQVLSKMPLQKELEILFESRDDIY